MVNLLYLHAYYGIEFVVRCFQFMMLFCFMFSYSSRIHS